MATDEETEVERLKREFAEERAESAKKQAEKDRQIAELARQVEKQTRRADAAEKVIEPTTYLSFLSLAHHKTFMSLEIETDSKLTSAGGAANTKNKRYPLHLKPWADFPARHAQCQQKLEDLFGDEKIFVAEHGVQTVRDMLRHRRVADEADMRHFQCLAVEAFVLLIMDKYVSRRDEPLPPSSSRLTEIQFYTNPYGLLVPDPDDDGQVTDDTPAYVPTLAPVLKDNTRGRGRGTGDGPPPTKRQASPRPRIYPDQWCFKVEAKDSYAPIFVIEYKAAHKLPATVLAEVLLEKDEGSHDEEQQGDDSDNDDSGELFFDVIRAVHSDTSPTDAATQDRIKIKRITAQVITQAFHYMVEFGLCYAYIASGEALLLLRLRPEDPTTVYYHLARPGTDVSSDKANINGVGNLHNTAVALVSSLVLMALDTPVLSQRWKREAQEVLQVWPVPYPEMGVVAREATSSSVAAKKPDLRPPRPQQGGCSDPVKEQRRRRKDDDDDDDDDDDHDHDYRPPPTPRRTAALTRTVVTSRNTRSSSSRGSSRGPSSTTGSRQHTFTLTFDPYCRSTPKNPLPYCTQDCLLGLRRSGPLDQRCPNVGLHERAETPGRHPGRHPTRHALTPDQLVESLREQLAEDLDDDCEGLDKYGKYGATGMLFRLVLRPYGYSFVAKGVQRPHMWILEHERGIYEDRRVAAQQGKLVPVCLGLLELVHEYISYTGAHISHMLLLSYGGEPLWKRQPALPFASWDGATADEADVDVDKLAEQAWAKLAALGVVHGDERAPNVVWNEERQAVMCIDFGRAQMRRLRERSPEGPHGDTAQTKRQRTEA